VNHGWLCDKGRYGIEWVHSDARVLEPQVDGREVSWPDALDRAAEAITKAKDLHGAASIAVLGGARGTNEDAYLWALLAKGVIRTDNVDAQIGDGLPAEFVLGAPRAEIRDLDRAAAVVVLDHDLREELPVAYLRLRRAVVEHKVPLVDLAPIGHELSERAAFVSRTVPGEALAGNVRDEIRRVSEGREGPIVVIVGRGNLAAQAHATVAAAAELAPLPDVRFLSGLRRANVHGALDAGLTPGFLPGRVQLDTGREWFTRHWGAVPKETGLDAEGILRAAADGKIRVLVLLGADPIADFPDATLARQAIERVDTIITVDAFVSDSTKRATVFLPCTLWGEKTGTVSNIEGRVQRVGRKVAPEGTAMDDWRIAVELALRLGADLDLATVDEVTDEIARRAPASAGATANLLQRARDGVVLPLRDHTDEVVLRTRDLTILADDGQGTSWDPIKVEGEADPTEAEQALEQMPEMPALHVWNANAVKREVPGRDAYALRLVVGRTLYDKGRQVAETPILQRLATTQAIRVHPSDLLRIGVDDGAPVKVTSARGSQVVGIVSDTQVPAGVARYDFTGDAQGAALLIDAGQPVTDLRVESQR
jgi:NADH-quinone oxidoreductase subunit G